MRTLINLSLSLAVFSFSLAYADDQTATPYQSGCFQAGGVPIKMQMMINIASPAVPTGEPRDVCLFNQNERAEVIALSTLESTTPSLAATAYRNAPAIWPLPARLVETADAFYCQKLGGTSLIGQGLVSGAYAVTKTSGQFSICMFADGSFVDTWSLFYKRYEDNPAVDLTHVFKSKVLNVDPHALWYQRSA